MKKTYLFCLLLLVLAVVLSGCISQATSVYDCDENWDCFEEKLLFCEKAKVKSEDWEGIRGSISPVAQPRGAQEEWPDSERYYATKTTTMEIESYEAHEGDESGFCYVTTIDLNVMRSYFEGDPSRGYTGGEISVELWKKALCNYSTMGPNKKEKEKILQSGFIPRPLYICEPLEKASSYTVPWEPKYKPTVKDFNLGDTSSDGNLNITVNSIEYQEVIGPSKYTTLKETAKEGSIFAIIDITLENISKREYYFPFIDMVFICNDSRGVFMPGVLAKYLENPLKGTILPNTTLRGQIANEIRKNCKSLELEIEFETGYKNFAVYKLK